MPPITTTVRALFFYIFTAGKTRAIFLPRPLASSTLSTVHRSYPSLSGRVLNIEYRKSGRILIYLFFQRPVVEKSTALLYRPIPSRSCAPTASPVPSRPAQPALYFLIFPFRPVGSLFPAKHATTVPPRPDYLALLCRAHYISSVISYLARISIDIRRSV